MSRRLPPGCHPAGRGWDPPELHTPEDDEDDRRAREVDDTDEREPDDKEGPCLPEQLS